MQKVFLDSAKLEKLAKEQFQVPDFIMMENAARSMQDFILSLIKERQILRPKVLILCGKGNNGGDGFALARFLLDKTNVNVYIHEAPSSLEAKTQFQMLQKLCISPQAQLKSDFDKNIDADIIVDCIYGTGFRGDIDTKTKNILNFINSSKAIKIACDIPSGFYFNADYTLTMGEHKLNLFSDAAKRVCGKIIKVELGLPENQFESVISPDAFLIEKCDINLPFRKNKAAHKGSYGHTTVIAGNKSGAGIITATAAMNFGSGLTSIVKSSFSNLEQFKISPELMISDTIPPKTTSVILGPGLGITVENKPSIEITKEIQVFKNWFLTSKNPACVLDADIFNYDELPALLDDLNSVKDSRIVLTPHPAELERFISHINKHKNNCINFDKSQFLNADTRLYIGKTISSLWDKVVLVMKSSNTFISAEENIYIVWDGTQNLAKGGSGDVLAGMIGALLAQNYSAKDAAITSCEAHALASLQYGSEAFDLIPEKLINAITTFSKSFTNS